MQTSLHRFLYLICIHRNATDTLWQPLVTDTGTCRCIFLPVPYDLLHTIHKAACIVLVPYRYIHMALPYVHVALPRSAIHTTYHGRRGRLGWLFCLFRIRDILVRIQMRIRILGSLPGSVQINYESGCWSGRPKKHTAFNLAEFPVSR
jgi:hypothetical protein